MVLGINSLEIVGVFAVVNKIDFNNFASKVITTNRNESSHG
jgi:hypothetical protein